MTTILVLTAVFLAAAIGVLAGINYTLATIVAEIFRKRW